MNKISWTLPSYKNEGKLPILPTEQEIDRFIAASGKILGTALQIAKETAMRIGEILNLKWIDIDFERSIITLNQPEKHCLPRVFKISIKLTAMIKNLPRRRFDKLFKTSVNGMETLLSQQRKRIIHKLQDDRMKLIRFHILRHWKATELYHQTQDAFFVRDFLGHRSFISTEN